jgi:hypothetical protein
VPGVNGAATTAANVEGELRQAHPRNHDLMIQWTSAFQTEVGEPADDAELRVDQGLAAGQLWPLGCRGNNFDGR